MKVLINERLSQHKYKTPEGYLICVDSILARTGKQTYHKNEVFDCDDSSEIEIDRPEAEVFSNKTLASFENKPITIEHPDEDVDIGNYKDYAVGFARDIKRGMFEGKPVMLGTLVITDEQAIADIESGLLNELSCGYDCDIADEENPQQRNIRGNHIALCERGRAGIARIVDSVKDVKLDAGYKLIGNKYNWELEGKAKNEKDALAKFKRRYPESYNTWGEELEYLARSGKDFESEPGEWALHFRFDDDYGYFYICVIEFAKRYQDSTTDTTMKQYEFNFIANEIDGEIITISFPCLSNEAAIATLRRRWTWTKMISVKIDGKEVKYQNGKIIDSEETQMKDKLVDIPSNLLSKLEDMFKQKDIHVARKGKTFTGRIHYQVEFGGRVKDLVRKLEEIEKTAKSLNIPMTFAADGNDDDTFATAGVDFDKIYVKDSIKDTELPETTNVRELLNKAMVDETTAIDIYNKILEVCDDDIRAVITEIRDDENDHLVKLTKLKNNISSNDEEIDDEEIVEDAASKLATIQHIRMTKVKGKYWVVEYEKSPMSYENEYFTTKDEAINWAKQHGFTITRIYDSKLPINKAINAITAVKKLSR